MTNQEAITKAVKLLRLSQSSNPNEAALAAGKAQEIIDRYKLGALSADFDDNGHNPDEPIKDFGSDPIEPSGRLATWKWRLFSTITAQNQCKGYVSRSAGGKGLAIIGRPSDAQTVRYIFGWLRAEVDRLAEKECRGFGITYANNFRIGAAEEIGKRLEIQREATDKAVMREAETEVASGTNSMAVMRLNTALVRREKQLAQVGAWAKQNLRLVSRSVGGGRSDNVARAHGRLAGQSVSLRPARATIAA
jgi:hypothetical protein